MPNSVNAEGLQIKTFNEVKEELTTSFRQIYGNDINIDSNTPDGQLINILSQVIIDLLELIAQVYNSFDPDFAIGTVLDQRIALNNIKRKGGTYSYTNIAVTTTASCTLNGLNTVDAESAFTVSDSQGTQWVLASTQTPSAAGTYTYSFRAKEIGAVESLPNTITTIVNAVVGVSTVNNPAALTVKGTDTETDAELKARRRDSIGIASQGYREALKAALLNTADVSYAEVYENETNTTDADGIPGHSIWTIVQGGTDEDVAQAIYAKRNGGCGMKGSTTYTITRSDGSTFEVAWDRPSTTNAYIEFDVTAITSHVIDVNAIKLALVNATLDIYQPLDINTVASIVKATDPDIIVTNCQVSTDGTNWYDIIYPTTKKDRLEIATSRITINEQ